MRARLGSQTPCFEGRALVPQGCSRPLRLAGRAGRGRELRRESPLPIPILVPIPVPVSIPIPVPVPVPSSSRPGRARPSPASRALRRLREAGTGAGGRRWRRPSESRGGGGSRAEGGGRAGLKPGRAEPSRVRPCGALGPRGGDGAEPPPRPGCLGLRRRAGSRGGPAGTGCQPCPAVPCGLRLGHRSPRARCRRAGLNLPRGEAPPAPGGCCRRGWARCPRSPRWLRGGRGRCPGGGSAQAGGCRASEVPGSCPPKWGGQGSALRGSLPEVSLRFAVAFSSCLVLMK